MIVRFSINDEFYTFDEWKNNVTTLEWLDLKDKPDNEEETDYHLTDCWNFLALHEKKEDEYNDENF